MFQIGIIGCGKIAQVRHIPEYKANPDANIHGYFDINTKRAEEMSALHGGKVYPSWQEMIQDPAIDAVSVCSANHTHAEISIAALQAGKHVLCEKPMAISLAECEEMVNAARESGKFLMIGHNQRLEAAHVKARELYRQGIIGQVVTFRTSFGHPGPEEWSVDPGFGTWFFNRKLAAMGAMADLGTHKTDLIHFLTGQLVVETTARLATINKKDTAGNPIGVDDNAMCIYRLSNGALGTMAASWTYYGEEENMTTLYGTRGIMEMRIDRHYGLRVIKSDGEVVEYDVGKPALTENRDLKTGPGAFQNTGIINEFINCMITGIPPEISGAEVMKAMRAIFASIESSKSGQTVHINQT